MTKSYFFTILFILPIVLNAQIKKQSISLGGQFYYGNETVKMESSSEKRNSETIGISAGMAFKENSIWGLNTSYSNFKNSDRPWGTDTVDFTNNRFDIGIFYREYKKLAKDLYFFGQLDGAFITANQNIDNKTSSLREKSRQRGVGVSITPGVSYRIFKKLHIEITIPNILGAQYLDSKLNSDFYPMNNSRRKSLSVYSNLNSNTALGYLGIGFRFII